MNESFVGQKLSKSASGLRMIPVSDSFASPFALAEPKWVADNEVTACASCAKNFDFFHRKHHCRRCGKCFCDRCCHYLLPLKRMYFVDPVRHCYDCAIISKAEGEFFDKSLKILQQAIQLLVYNDAEELQGKFNCSIATDHRSIIFTPLKSKNLNNIQPIPTLFLRKVLDIRFQISTSADDPSLKVPVSATITYKDEEDSLIVHELKLTPVVLQPSLPWLSALQKAKKLIFESKADAEN